MLKFNFLKTSRVPLNFYRKNKDTSRYLSLIKENIRANNFDLPESFLTLPDKKENYKDMPKSIKLIIVVGIGGSCTGTKAVFQALNQKKKLTEIIFLDSLNPLFLSKIIKQVSRFKKGEVLVCLASKSGETFEVLANFFTFIQEIKKYCPKIFVISEKNSFLQQFAQKNKFSFFSVPRQIGGRYSIFGPVSLLPLKMAGIDVNSFLSGARQANQTCLIDDPLKNPAFSSALTIFYHWKKGKNIYSNFIFPPDLEGFGRWYVQLMAESLGKNKKGITPITTIGTADLHSLGQLYFDGPKDKLVNFVFIDNLGFDYSIPQNKQISVLSLSGKGKKIWQINRAIFEGVKKAYLKKNLVFTETILSGLDEKNLGILFETKMVEIILLAKLMKVNPFGQPGVELYKKETRKIIKKM